MERVSEAAMLVLLKKRYNTEEYAFFPGVPCGTGIHAGTTADAVAYNLWPSRGLTLSGFEIKCSRSDFLREIKSPAKSEPVQKYCHFWWMVVSDLAIVQKGELPKTWGLMYKDGNNIKVKVQAPELKAKAMDPIFIASIMRAAKKHIVPKHALEELHKDAFEEGKKQGAQDQKWYHDRAQERLKEAEARIERFETASGVKIDKYEYGPIGKCVKALLYGNHGVKEHIENLKIRIRRNGEESIDLKEELKELEALDKRLQKLSKGKLSEECTTQTVQP
jgi:hypothetical protein